MTPPRLDIKGWMQLALIPLFTLIISGLTLYINDLNHNSDSTLAADQRRETELKTYLDKMEALVFTDNLLVALTPSPTAGCSHPTPFIIATVELGLSPSSTGLPTLTPSSTVICNTPMPRSTIPVGVVEIANAETANVLRQLEADGPRKGIVVQFLYRSHLIVPHNPTVDLKNANLQNIDLSNVDLTGISLYQSDLTNAKLAKTILINAYLLNATLTKADLSGADLRGADLSNATLTGANVTPDQLNQAKSLTNATMPDGTIHP